MAAGFALLAVGGVLSLPVVPGPGVPLILLGLVLLREHFAWADRSLVYLKQKIDRLRGSQAFGGVVRDAGEPRG
jgi:hypothetical protein